MALTPVMVYLPILSIIQLPPPIATCILFAQATATDNCGSDFTLTFNDVTTNGDCAGEYSITRTWTATDACNKTAAAPQAIKVKYLTSPVLDVLTDISTIHVPATTNFAQATATDICGSDISLTFNSVTQHDY